MPGLRETLRVNGRAQITTDPALLEPCTVQGKAPRSGILVTAEEVYFHCGKALIRSDLWNPEKHIAQSDFPSLGRHYHRADRRGRFGRGSRALHRAQLQDPAVLSPALAETADVIVIGAGIAGAAAAAHLADERRVVLLERESQPGYHSTGRSAALFTETYGNRAIRILTGASRAFYEAWADGFTEHPILTPRGALMFAMPGQEEALATAWAELSPRRSAGPPARRGGGAGDGAGAARRTSVIGAVHEPDSMDIDVHELHQGYLRRFRQRGGRLVTDAGVRALRYGDGQLDRGDAGRRFHRAVIVNAAGAWADVVAGSPGCRRSGWCRCGAPR